MAELITIYWRDIPSQVIARAGRKSAKRLLSSRFQEAIDRAAMRAGKGSSDAYMEDWERVRSACGGDLESAADVAAEALEARFGNDDLDALAKSRGLRGGLSDDRLARLWPESIGDRPDPA